MTSTGSWEFRPDQDSAGPTVSAPRHRSAETASAARRASAADHGRGRARRGVQFGLAAIWLLDASLQAQPFMFGKGLATQIIAPAGVGSPGFVTAPMALAVRIILHAPVWWNALFAGIELIIGLGLLWRRTARIALAGSIVWGLAVWWLGEGLGGMLSGIKSPVTGAPGAALLYVLISLLAWPPRSGPLPARSVASGGLLGQDWARAAWLAVWGGGAYLLLLPSNRAAGALSDQVTDAASGEPHWLTAADRHASVLLGTRVTSPELILAAVFAVIAVGIFIPAMSAPVVVLAVITSAAIWLFGEALGGMFTGQVTDPNTGPLLMLLAISYWPLRRPKSTDTQLPTRRGVPVAEPPGPPVQPQARTDTGRSANPLPARWTPDAGRRPR
jgi:hypothetical protein